jgi:glycosyltransferase involved in cell wall biosynthesis
VCSGALPLKLMSTETVPKITIVTPSFNQGAYIEEALFSVKQQDYPNVEHIVIDGGSTDQTLSILRQLGGRSDFSHLRWISEPDRGQSDALNKGFRAAEGEIIGWLNSDDRYRAGAFDAAVQAWRSCAEADIIYGDYALIDQNGRVRRIRREIEFSHFILQYHRVLYIPTTATFFRRRIIDDQNWIDVQLQFAMDYDFFLRLAQRGYRFQHVRFLLADFRQHSESKSASICKQLQEHDAVAARHSPLLRGLRGVAPRAIAFKSLRSAAAMMRYSEKLLRGYYFEQWRPRTLQSKGRS